MPTIDSKAIVILRAVRASATFAEAVCHVPEDWTLFVSGPGNGSFLSALHPPGLADNHILVRLHRAGGLSFAIGKTRIESLHACVDFVLNRCGVPSLEVAAIPESFCATGRP